MSRLLAIAAALAASALVACGTVSAGTTPRQPSQAKPAGAAPAGCAAPAAGEQAAAAGGPVIGTRAFAGHGELAFVSANRLYILDGRACGKPAVLHAVNVGKVPYAPAWSPDGRWLAVLVGDPAAAPGSASGGALWLARADGSDATQVLPDVWGFAWSPTTDELVADGTVGGRSGLFELRPGQPPDDFSPPISPTGTPAWSPDGRTVAFTQIQVNAMKQLTGSELETVPAAGGAPVVRAASKQNAFILDGWWSDGRGLFAWTDPLNSASLAADGLPLVSYPLRGRPVTLGTTLAHPSFASPLPGGVTLVAGGDRFLWDGKTIRTCLATGRCYQAMDAEPGPVNLDPAWARTQEPLLAFVHGAAKAPSGLGQASLQAWYKTRVLMYYIAGGNPLPVRNAGTGIASPTWSADGQYILYVRDNGLWLIHMFAGNGSLLMSPAQRVVNSLFFGAWPSYYGYVDWQSQFAWHS
jgi:TolB protein